MFNRPLPHHPSLTKPQKNTVGQLGKVPCFVVFSRRYLAVIGHKDQASRIVFRPERPSQISPGQSEAASAAKRRPGFACIEIASPVKGDTNGINRDCATLNRADLINLHTRSGAFHLVTKLQLGNAPLRSSSFANRVQRSTQTQIPPTSKPDMAKLAKLIKFPVS